MNRILLTLSIVFSLSLTAIKAQTKLPNQWWFTGNTLTAITDTKPFKLGVGVGLQLSWEKQIGMNSSFGIQVGYRQIGSYNRVYIEHYQSFHPSGIQRYSHTTHIQTFRFGDLGVCYRQGMGYSSPWSFEFGLSGSSVPLPKVRSFTEKLGYARQYYFEAATALSAAGVNSRRIEISRKGERQHYSSYDISIALGVNYEFTPGCRAKLTFQQGTQNLIKTGAVSVNHQAQHYLSMIALGFNARIY